MNQEPIIVDNTIDFPDSPLLRQCREKRELREEIERLKAVLYQSATKGLEMAARIERVKAELAAANAVVRSRKDSDPEVSAFMLAVASLRTQLRANSTANRS